MCVSLQEASVSRLTTTSEKATIQPFSITTAVGTVYVLIGLWENAAALGDDSDKHASTNAATTATPHTDLSEGRLRGYIITNENEDEASAGGELAMDCNGRLSLSTDGG